MSIDANELLMSGGIKAAKFDTLGATVVGTIVEPPKAQQMTKYGTDEPDFWPSGDPKMQIVVTIQTDQRDPADAQDDGKRRLYIVPRMMAPVREAVRRAGAPGLEVGGRIAVRWSSGTGQGQGNPKEYTAEYARPAIDPGSLLGGNAQPAAPAPAAQQQATPTAPPAPASPAAQSLGLGAAQPAQAPAAQTAPPGIDPAAWANLPDQQRQAVLAAMGSTGGQLPPF